MPTTFKSDPRTLTDPAYTKRKASISSKNCSGSAATSSQPCTRRAKMCFLPALYYGRSAASGLPCAGAAPPQRPPRATHRTGASPPSWHGGSAPQPTLRMPTGNAVQSPTGGEDKELVETHPACGLVVTKKRRQSRESSTSRQPSILMTRPSSSVMQFSRAGRLLRLGD